LVRPNPQRSAAGRGGGRDARRLNPIALGIVVGLRSALWLASSQRGSSFPGARSPRFQVGRRPMLSNTVASGQNASKQLAQTGTFRRRRKVPGDDAR
jgi:hypothetical protein